VSALAPHLPVAVRVNGALYCPACADPARGGVVDLAHAAEASGAVCPRCKRPVRADERSPLYIGSAFVGSAVEHEIDHVPHEQAFDYFVALSLPELRRRQSLAAQQIAAARASPRSRSPPPGRNANAATRSRA